MSLIKTVSGVLSRRSEKQGRCRSTREATNDQNSILRRSGWAACRIVFHRICKESGRGTQRRSFQFVAGTTIQVSYRRTRYRTSRSVRLRARTIVQRTCTHYHNRPWRIGLCPRLPQIITKIYLSWNSEAAAVGGLFHFKPSVFCQLDFAWARRRSVHRCRAKLASAGIEVRNDPGM